MGNGFEILGPFMGLESPAIAHNATSAAAMPENYPPLRELGMIEINGIAHVILTVSDWDKAHAFVVDLLQPEEGQQVAVEGVRLVPIADREDHVRHAVDLDHSKLPQRWIILRHCCRRSRIMGNGRRFEAHKRPKNLEAIAHIRCAARARLWCRRSSS